MNIPKELQIILNKINESGHAFIVGGAVRDHFLNIESFDFDIEVYFLDFDVLVTILKSFGNIEIYENFKVIAFKNYEFTLPRTESKRGDKHTDFIVYHDPFLDQKTACLRRDFTCNQLMYDYKNDVVIDHFNGLEAIKNKELVMISEKFSEDPLRAFRAFRFMCTLGFSLEAKTKDFCFNLLDEFDSLSIERINFELQKAIDGQYFLKTIENFSFFLNKFIPFDEMKLTNQSLTFHPEGDVFEHTLQTIECLDFLDFDSEYRLVLIITLLLHDIGKVSTTEVNDGRISSHDHEYQSYLMSQDVISYFSLHRKHQNLILMLVRDHLFPRTYLYRSNKDKLDLYLSYKGNFHFLLIVAWCDYMGRTLHRSKEEYLFRKEEYYLNYIVSWNSFTNHVDFLMHKYNGHFILNLGFKGRDVGLKQYEFVLEDLNQFFKN